MSRAKKIIFYTSLLIFLAYIIFGVFFLQYPGITADDNWEISRFRNLIQLHRIDEPLFKKETSPFMAMYFNATPANQLIGLFKTGAFALVWKLSPLNEHDALHFTSFLWSILLCISVYLLAREFRLPKFTARLSIIVLIIAPEFLLQVHRSRVELVLALSFAVYVILLLRTLCIENETKKRIYLILIGLTSWIPAICLHPTGMFLPGALGIIYLVLNRKKIFSANTFLLGISFLPGFFLYSFVYFSISSKAELMGGGNYFNVQGPPVLEQPFYKFIFKVPILFYKNFASFNFLSKPVSLFLFLIFLAGTWLIYKKKQTLVQFYPVILPGFITALTIAYFLSGSYAPFNIIIFPFIAIVIAFMINDFIESKRGAITKSVLISGALILVFTTNFYGLSLHKKYNAAYIQLQAELREAIPPGVPILGSTLHYTTFENQPYYHVSWFGEDMGIPDQSFEEGVVALNVKYIIVDDIFMAKAVASNRGNEWFSGLTNYLNEKCTLLDTIRTNYYVGGRIWKPELFPESWRYKGMKRNFLQKVCIYKVNSEQFGKQ
jgi:hypothetical protein